MIDTSVLINSFGNKAGQYEITSWGLGLPPEKPVIPGGPDVITGVISYPNLETLFISLSITVSLRTISLESLYRVSIPLWQEEKPIYSVFLFEYLKPSNFNLFQIISGMIQPPKYQYLQKTLKPQQQK